MSKYNNNNIGISNMLHILEMFPHPAKQFENHLSVSKQQFYVNTKNIQLGIISKHESTRRGETSNTSSKPQQMSRSYIANASVLLACHMDGAYIYIYIYAGRCLTSCDQSVFGGATSLSPVQLTVATV